MTKLLEDKVILITGAGGGIGRAASVLAVQEGAVVAITDLSQEALHETMNAIEGLGGTATAIVADLTDPNAVASLVDEVVKEHGRLDGAFNNAGLAGTQIGQSGKKLAEWTDEAFDKILDVNLKGVWYCMRNQLLQMKDQGYGAIVNTASLAGIAGFADHSGYTAAKHGVVGLTKVAALEYAPTVRVNTVCPGRTNTDLIKDTMKRMGNVALGKIPAGRLAEPREIAEMACWLLSDRASYVTGGVFVVDGGHTAG